MIELIGVSAGYGEGDVIREISFSVVSGEIYILLGPNGAGKTTVFRVASGVLPPSKGEVLIDGISIWKNAGVKSKIGYLPEGERVYPDLSVSKNLEFFARIYGVEESRVDEVLREFGLYEYRRKMAGTLSRGLRKRLALARATLHDPEILILDEPFSNLDINSVIAMRDRIEQMLEREKAILFSTHILDELYNFENMRCRIAIIKGGRIQVEGDLQSLMGGREVLLRVVEPARAAEVLRNAGLSVSVKNEGVVVPSESIPKATRVLVSSNIEIFGVSHLTNSLEKFFKN